jgi:HK97 family phage portal protein
MGPPGVLFDKGIGMEETFYSEEQQKNLEDKFRKMSGTSNSGTIAVTSGNLDYINFGLSAIDLAIMDTLKMTLLDVCNIYHVPSQLFNSEVGKTYTNLKEARQQMYTDAVLPIANKVYSKIGKSLIPRYKDLKAKNAYLKVVTSNVPELQADMKELAEWLDKAWYLTPNEARQKMSYDPIEDEMMDEVYINASKVPLSMSGMQPEAMASKVNADSLNDK